VAPRPLLMILARNDAIVPPDSNRKAFARAGEPKRLLEIRRPLCGLQRTGADEAGQAATEWFTKFLSEPFGDRLSRLASSGSNQSARRRTRLTGEPSREIDMPCVCTALTDS
jgi:hypothetical protein